MSDIINIKFKGTFEGKDEVIRGVKDLASNISNILKKSITKVGGSDVFTTLVSGLQNLKTAAAGATQETKKTGEAMAAELKKAQTEADKLNKLVQGMGDSYAKTFISANRAIDGLKLGDFADILESLKLQFNFFEQHPLFAKNIAEAKTINDMIARLYETLVKVNAVSKGTKIGLPELEQGLVAAIKMGNYYDEILMTEQAMEASLAKNVALQLEQNQMLAKQEAELTDIAAIEKERMAATEKITMLYRQMEKLKPALGFADEAGVSRVTAGMERLMILHSQIDAIATHTMMTDSQIADANARLVGFKNQVLEVANRIGVSYDKELNSEAEIVRLYEMKQRMISQSIGPMQMFMTMVGNTVEQMRQMVAIPWGGPIFQGYEEKLPATLQTSKNLIEQVHRIWEEMRLSMSQNVPMPLINQMDVLRLKLEEITSKFILINGGAGGGGTVPPVGAGVATPPPPPDPSGWNEFEDSVRRIFIESNKLYQQLQEIASLKMIKGDEFDAITERVKAMEAEIDRAAKALASLGTADLSGDKLAMNIIELSNQAKALQREFAGLTQAEKTLDVQLQQGKISATDYALAMGTIRQQQDNLKASAATLHEQLANTFKDVQVERQKAQINAVRVEYQNLEVQLQRLGTTGLDAGARLQILQRQMQLLKDEVKLNNGATAELNASYKLKAEQMAKTSKVVNEAEGILRKYGMRMRQLITWQLEWYAGAGLIWGAFFKIKNALTEFLNYSQGLTDVAAITQATAAEIVKMDEVVRRIATSSTMGFKGGADALKIMGQAGMSAADSMDALNTVAMLTTATGSSTVEVVKVLTTAMNVWNISAKESVRIGDSLAAALNYSKLEIGDLAVAFNYVAPQARLMGESLESTLGMVSQLSQMGIRASTIGTGLSQFMGSLLAPSKKFQEALAKVNLSIKDLTDSEGRLLPFIGIIRKLERAGMDVATVFEGLEKREARNLAVSLVAGSYAFEAMTKAIGSAGAMTVMFNKSMEGTQNQLKVVGNQLLDVIFAAFKKIEPAVVAVTKAFKELLITLKDVGPFLLIIGGVAALPRILGLVVTGVTALTTAIKGLFVASSAMSAVPMFAAAGTPWGLIIVGITALIGVITALRYTFDDAREAKKAYDEGMAKAGEHTKAANEALIFLGMIKAEKTTTEERITAYEKLKALMPQLGETYKDSATAVKDLRKEHSDGITIINKYTQALIDNAVAAQMIGSRKAFDEYRKLNNEIKKLTESEEFSLIEKLKGKLTPGAEGWLASQPVLLNLEKLKKKMGEFAPEVENTKKMLAGLSEEHYTYARAMGFVDEELHKEIILMRAANKVAGERPIPSDKRKDKDAEREIEKDYYSQMLSALKQYSNATLGIEKSYRDLRLSEIDNQHRLGLMSEREYIDKKIQMLEEEHDIQLKIIDEERSEMESLYAAKIAKTKTDPERKAIEAKHLADLQQLNKKEVDLEVKTQQQKQALQAQGILKGSQITAEGLQHIYNMTIEALKQETDAKLDAYKLEEDSLKYLYDHQLISSVEFYAKSLELLQQDTEARKEELQKQLEAYIALEVALANLPGVSPEKQQAVADKLTEVYQKFQGDIVKLSRDSADKRIKIERDAAENIEQIWRTSGTLGVISKALDDVDKKWQQTWNDIFRWSEELYTGIKDAFSNIVYNGITNQTQTIGEDFKNLGKKILRMWSDTLAQMATMALKQKIIIPMIQMIIPWGGSGGTGLSGLSADQMMLLGMQNPNSQNLADMLSGGTGTGGVGGLGGIFGDFGGMMLGSIQHMESFINALGGATESVWNVANAVTPYLPLVGPLISGLKGNWGGAIGGLAGFGGSMLLGAKLGSIWPGIGTAIGMLLGGIIGNLFKKKPDFGEIAAGYKPGGTESGVIQDGEWRRYSTGQYTFSTNMSDNGWPMSDAEMKKVAEAFQKVGDNVKDVLEKLGMDVSGFAKEWSMQIDLKGLDAEGVKEKINQWMGDFLTEATNIDFSQWQKEGEDIIDTISRILTALEKINKFGGKIEDMIDAIEGDTDAIQKWKAQLTAAEEQIAAVKKSLMEATDPADAEQFAEQWAQAVYQIYWATKQMVDNLVNAITQAQMQMLQFNFDLTSKIDELLGTSDAIGVAMDNINFVYGKITEALAQGNNASAFQWIQQGVGAVDQWLSATISSIQANYAALEAAAQKELEAKKEAIDAQIEATKNQIDALNEQLSVIKGWKSLLERITKTINDLTTSTANPQDAIERLGIAKSEVDRLQALYDAAQTPEEKQELASQLAEALQTYLSVAQEAYQRPSPEYQAIFTEVVAGLEAIQGDAKGYADQELEIEKQIKALEEKQTLLQEEANNLQKQQTDYTAQMNAEIAAAKKQAADWYQWLKNTGIPILQGNIDTLKDKLADIIGDKTVEEYLADLQLAAVTELAGIRTILSKIAQELVPGFVPSFAREGFASGPMLARIGDAVGEKGEWVLHDSTVQSMLKAMVNNYARPPEPQYHTQPIEPMRLSVTIGTIHAKGNKDDAKAMAAEIAQQLDDKITQSLKAGKYDKIISRKQRYR